MSEQGSEELPEHIKCIFFFNYWRFRMTSCPPVKAKISVGIRSEAVVTIRTPRLSPQSVVGLSIQITVRVHHRKNIPSQSERKVVICTTM